IPPLTYPCQPWRELLLSIGFWFSPDDAENPEKQRIHRGDRGDRKAERKRRGRREVKKWEAGERRLPSPLSLLTSALRSLR
ncbi:MAG: hypothetical protein K2W96_12585, partial [Gemmataceae bacterium]|nr:hypothetical protein [Gemmataceae bacterium]